MNWTEAYGQCRRNQASIVTIEHEAENNVVFAQVLKLSGQSKENIWLWIGYHDLEVRAYKLNQVG